AIQELVPDNVDALTEQFTKIGRRHYMHGAEAVNMLCASPCAVQSMYNLYVASGKRIVGLLEGVAAHPNQFEAYLVAARLIEPSPAVESERPPWTEREKKIVESIFEDGKLPLPTSPRVSAPMMDPSN